MENKWLIVNLGSQLRNYFKNLLIIRKNKNTLKSFFYINHAVILPGLSAWIGIQFLSQKLLQQLIK